MKVVQVLFHGDGEGRGEVRWRNGRKGRQHKWLIGPFLQKRICIFIFIRVDTHFVEWRKDLVVTMELLEKRRV